MNAVHSDRVRNFLRQRNEAGPCLVVDLSMVRAKYHEFKRYLPDTKIYYAIKANPAPEILSLLEKEGSCFDAASVPEIKMCLASGAGPDRISYGNTIKKEKDIAEAYRLGVRLFAFDSEAELDKIARAAPGAQVLCRVLCDGSGAEWPLTRKFGCSPDMAEVLLESAKKEKNLIPAGISFHVGSQQTNPDAWNKALAQIAKIFKNSEARGVTLNVINMGGGFPSKYVKEVPTDENYADVIKQSLRRHFGDQIPETIIEPGRGMVGNSGVIETEIVLISQKQFDDPVRWVYLDIGKFGGLAETEGEAIRYPIYMWEDADNNAEKTPCVIAGPTCDSADVLYEHTLYPLPVTLKIGDKVLIGSAGAYTLTYCAVAFNGFPPLKSYCI